MKQIPEKRRKNGVAKSDSSADRLYKKKMMMNRYEMSVRKNNAPVENPQTKFKPTSSITEICKYIRYCINHQTVFRAEDMPEGKLDAAVIITSKSIDIPVLVDSTDDMLALSAAYSHREVYTLDTLPKNTAFVIHYTQSMTESPKGVRPWVTVIKRSKQ